MQTFWGNSGCVLYLTDSPCSYDRSQNCRLIYTQISIFVSIHLVLATSTESLGKTESLIQSSSKFIGCCVFLGLFWKFLPGIAFALRVIRAGAAKEMVVSWREKPDYPRKSLREKAVAVVGWVLDSLGHLEQAICIQEEGTSIGEKKSFYQIGLQVSHIGHFFLN